MISYTLTCIIVGLSLYTSLYYIRKSKKLDREIEKLYDELDEKDALLEDLEELLEKYEKKYGIEVPE